MNSLNSTLRVVVTIIILTAAILASLAVFGAFTFAELGDDLLKLVAVGGIAIATSAIIALLNRK